MSQIHGDEFDEYDKVISEAIEKGEISLDEEEAHTKRPAKKQKNSDADVVTEYDGVIV